MYLKQAILISCRFKPKLFPNLAEHLGLRLKRHFVHDVRLQSSGFASHTPVALARLPQHGWTTSRLLWLLSGLHGLGHLQMWFLDPG